jgi:hypothetical protein
VLPASAIWTCAVFAIAFPVRINAAISNCVFASDKPISTSEPLSIEIHIRVNCGTWVMIMQPGPSSSSWNVIVVCCVIVDYRSSSLCRSAHYARAHRSSQLCIQPLARLKYFPWGRHMPLVRHKMYSRVRGLSAQIRQHSALYCQNALFLQKRVPSTLILVITGATAFTYRRLLRHAYLLEASKWSGPF